MAPFTIPPTRNKQEAAMREAIKVLYNLHKMTRTYLTLYPIVTDEEMPC
jgi:hypothetical protein